MDNRVRIIKLGPVSTPNEAYTFEEAFGEYSEARGKGRARRKKRKLERIANRKEVRSARQAARAELQQERIAKRRSAQQARQEKRTLAGETRQQRRTGRLLSREERRNIRTQGELDRDALMQEAELASQDQGLDTEVSPDMGVPVDNSDSYMPEDSGSYAPQDTGSYVPEDTGSYMPEDTGYYAPEDTGYYAPEDSGYGTSYGSDESAYDYGSDDFGSDSFGSEGDYSEEGDYVGGGDYLAEYGDVDMPFDGIMGAEDRFSEFSEGMSIDPELQDTVNKLVWNKELISRLEKRRKNVGGDRKQAFSKQIILRKKRANELQSQLDGYCNVEGEYSGADGKIVAAKRRAQLAQAFRVAKRNRRRMIQPQVTPIEKELNPTISPNRIVVPAKSAFTGLNGIDLQDDFDAPAVREIMLGADGSKTSTISWTNVAIGLAVGAAAIWALKKYKIVK
jgi:hypothetical protein